MTPEIITTILKLIAWLATAVLVASLLGPALRAAGTTRLVKCRQCDVLYYKNEWDECPRCNP